MSASIFGYRKVSLPHTVVTARLPDSQGELHANELCTLDGVTYVSLPDGLALPEQPDGIVLAPVDVTDALRAQIKAASPHLRLIAERMEDKIRAAYSANDEQYFARIGVGKALGLYEMLPGEQDQLIAFGVFVEGVRQWGRDERALLGL